VQQHDEVASQLDDKEYERSARESFENLEPAERRKLPVS